MERLITTTPVEIAERAVSNLNNFAIKFILTLLCLALLPCSAAAENGNLHSSLREFSDLRLLWETENYLVRVDDMGNMSFRYAAWPIGSSQSEEPDLILYGGTVNRDGSGGNHYYLFQNNEYTYECYVWVIGLCETPGYLSVSRNGSEILREDVIEELFSY